MFYYADLFAIKELNWIMKLLRKLLAYQAHQNSLQLSPIALIPQTSSPHPTKQAFTNPIPTAPTVIKPIETPPIATTPIGTNPIAIIPRGAIPIETNLECPLPRYKLWMDFVV